MERALSLTSREETQRIVGMFDRNLRRVRDATGAEIVVRNSQIHVRGPRRSVERAVRVLARLKELAATQELIGSDQVEEALGETPAEAPGAALPGAFRRDAKVEPRTEGQGRYLAEIDRHAMVFAVGPAGTGKTFLAVAKAVECLRTGAIRRVVLVRPAVEAGERLGFLPGDIQAKVNPYLRPIYDSLNFFLEYGQLRRLIESDVVEICPLAYMRGRTLDEAFIILDEAQNTTSEQMLMFLTRMGGRSKVVVTGDVTQVDLPPGKPSGLVEAREILAGVPGLSFVTLTQADIVRHPLVQQVVEAYARRRQDPAR